MWLRSRVPFAEAKGREVFAIGIILMVCAGVVVMLDTDFGRRVPCEVTHVGYDSYVDGEWVERVDEVE